MAFASHVFSAHVSKSNLLYARPQSLFFGLLDHVENLRSRGFTRRDADRERELIPTEQSVERSERVPFPCPVGKRHALGANANLIDESLRSFAGVGVECGHVPSEKPNLLSGELQQERLRINDAKETAQLATRILSRDLPIVLRCVPLDKKLYRSAALRLSASPVAVEEALEKIDREGRLVVRMKRARDHMLRLIRVKPKILHEDVRRPCGSAPAST